MENKDLRTLSVLLTSKVNNMCNAKTTEEVVNEFAEAKDLLVALFKNNVDRLSN